MVLEACGIARFRLGEDVPVAIVVVADIMVYSSGARSRHTACRESGGTSGVTISTHRGSEKARAAESRYPECFEFRIFLGEQAIGELDRGVVEATSVAWIEQVIMTMVLPSSARRAASAG